MAEVRNAIPFPGVYVTPEQGLDNILYSTANLVVKGFTFAEGNDALDVGQVVAVDEGLFVAYTGAEGQEAVGVLLQPVDVKGSRQLANVALGGEFIADKLIGMDQDAIDALGAVEVDLGKVTIIRF